MGFRGARSWDVYMRIVSIGSYMLVFEVGQAPHSTELVSLRFCTRIVTLYSSPVMARAFLLETSSPALFSPRRCTPRMLSCLPEVFRAKF